MGAASTYARHDAVAHGWIGMALAMLALALGCGYALALGEMAGLYVGLSLVFAVAVLFDFRVGAVLLVLMLPVSASALFPHGLLRINGLNPLNMMMLATLASYVIHGRVRHAAGALLPMQVALLYIAPIVVAGMVGVHNMQAMPSFLHEIETISFGTQAEYVIIAMVKPFVIVVASLLIGAAAARSRRPELFIVPLALSALLIGLIQIGFVVAQGVPLATMASPGARSFYEPLGLHANSLGRMHMYAFALLLFIWVEARQPRLKLLLLCALTVVTAALLLTFSRAAIGGAGIIGALFLLWKFNARTLAMSLAGFLVVALLAGDVLYSRMTLGLGEGANTVSAGRIEGLWLPLLPDLLRTPPWGNGLHSIVWSDAMVAGFISPVMHPHNAFIEALLDMGIAGAALLVAFYVKAWKGFRKLSRSDRLTPEMRGLFLGASAAVLAFFVTGLVGSTLRVDSDSAFLWIALGLMYGLRGRTAAAA